MRTRAILRLKHDAVLSAREKLGMSQKQLAAEIGVSLRYIQELETLRFADWSSPYRFGIAEKIAFFLGLPVEQVLPPELVGKGLQTVFTRVADVDMARLLEVHDIQEQRLSLPSPEEVVEQNDMGEVLKRWLNRLPNKECVVLKLRYGIDMEDSRARTLSETAKVIRVTRERVSQIERRALYRLKRAREGSDFICKLQKARGTKPRKG
jgi:RNA polymerase sigma factor (sigma-70 family)